MLDASSHHFRSPSSSIGMKMSDSLTPGEKLHLFHRAVTLSGLCSVVWRWHSDSTPVHHHLNLPDWLLCVQANTLLWINKGPLQSSRAYLLPAVHQECRGLTPSVPSAKMDPDTSGTWSEAFRPLHSPVSDGSLLSNNPGARVVWPGANIKPLWSPDVHIFSWLYL